MEPRHIAFQEWSNMSTLTDLKNIPTWRFLKGFAINNEMLLFYKYDQCTQLSDRGLTIPLYNIRSRGMDPQQPVLALRTFLRK
jgi:hypothetical protein